MADRRVTTNITTSDLIPNRTNMGRNNTMFGVVLLASVITVMLQPVESADPSTCDVSMAVWWKELKSKLCTTVFEHRCMVRKLVMDKLPEDQLGENLIKLFDFAMVKLNKRLGPYRQLIGLS